MKPATEKKVKEIINRANDLRASCIGQVMALKSKTASEEDKLIPRVSGIVVREGQWLLRIAQKFIDRHDLELSESDTQIVLEAKKFFDDLSGVHKEEISKNEFIFRMSADFIPHLIKLATMILKFDADVKLRIAKIEADDADDDAELQEEIDAAMTS